MLRVCECKKSKMADFNMAAMCELSHLRMSLSLWAEFECSLLGICGCQCDCHAIHVSNMAESKMADFKMATMCELS